MTLLREDRQLLHRFRRGEAEALAAVYRAYVDQVAGFLRGGFAFKSKGEPYTFAGFRSPSDLQDALQETFCRAFSERARLAYELAFARAATDDEVSKAQNFLSEVSEEKDTPGQWAVFCQALIASAEFRYIH